jgi:divalent metal cation (Fe/Co/Zn/Cd) transporter
VKEKNNSILVSLIGNVLLVAGKGIAGLLANSNALVADAVHSLSDVSVFLINYRACEECKMYGRIGGKELNKRNRQHICDVETRSTYYSGALFFAIGIAICLHNFVILVLDKVETPGVITFIVAIVALAVYVWLYKHTGNNNDQEEGDCRIANRNVHWQNKINLYSGAVVVIGLAGVRLGFIFMDEVAAVVVGSIMGSMGIKLLLEVEEEIKKKGKQYFKFVIIGSIITAAILASISLSIQI